MILLNRKRVAAFSITIGAFVFLAAFAALLQWGGQALVAARVEWCQRHVLFLAGMAVLVTCIIVARRRSITRAEAARSWLAALPMRPAMGYWERFVVEMVPAYAALIILAALFVLVPTSSASLSVWLMMTLGVGLGGFLSYLIPAPKIIALPPGSRYVPRRRTAVVNAVRPSLDALGYWPIRQMFARAQPRLVARASMPILLSIGLGTTADAAMLTVASFALIGFLLLLISSLISVSDAAYCWLRPLPMSPWATARRTWIRSLALMAGISCAEVGLFWVGGTPPFRSAKIGLAIWISSWLVAVGGSLIAFVRRARAG